MNIKCQKCGASPNDTGQCGCDEPFNLNAIPKPMTEGIARTIYPHIVAYFQVPEHKAAFEEWKRERAARKGATAPCSP